MSTQRTTGLALSELLHVKNARHEANTAKRLEALAKPVWVIYADGDHDQTCYSEREAKREAKDLKAMGFVVKVKPMTLEDAADKGLT